MLWFVKHVPLEAFVPVIPFVKCLQLSCIFYFLFVCHFRAGSPALNSLNVSTLKPTVVDKAFNPMTWKLRQEDQVQCYLDYTC